MEATRLATTIDSHNHSTLKECQPVRIRHGALSGLHGALVEMAAPGRAMIALQPGVWVEIDQECLELYGST